MVTARSDDIDIDIDTATVPPQRLEHLPVSAFAVVMGISGLAVGWLRATDPLGVPEWIGLLIAWLGLGLWLLVAGLYLVKLIKHPAAVAAEFRHPVRIAFVPTITVGLLVLSIALLDAAGTVSAVLWWVGAAGQAVLAVHVMRVWLTGQGFQAGHVHPAWFIPVVGNLVVPLAGVSHAPAEVSWFFFAVGIGYWPILLSIVVQRLILAGPLPPRLAPTLAILVAPPAVGLLAWRRLGGQPDDALSRILLGLVLFQLLLLAAQASGLRRIPFALSAWAYSFPLAAASTALLVTCAATDSATYRWLGGLLLGVASLAVVGLVARTAVAIRRREICRPE